MQEAEDALSDTKMLAPFPGWLRAPCSNHQTGSAGQPIVKLQNKDTVDVVVHIPERDLPKAPRRADNMVDTSNVRVVFDNFPGQEFPVAVKEFQTEADPDTQTYELRLSVTCRTPCCRAGHDGIGAGGSGTIHLDVFTVPSESVFQTPMARRRSGSLTRTRSG